MYNNGRKTAKYIKMICLLQPYIDFLFQEYKVIIKGNGQNRIMVFNATFNNILVLFIDGGNNSMYNNGRKQLL
jgi:hypothetical protein